MPQLRQYPAFASVLPTDALWIDRVGAGTGFVEGAVLPGMSGVYYDTVAALQAATVSSIASLVFLGGYASAGDGGADNLKRSGAAGPGPGLVQSADGQWWVRVPGPVNPEQFGATGNGVAIDTGALNAMLAWLTSATGLGELSARSYAINAPLTLTGQGIGIQGEGIFASLILSTLGNHDLLVCSPAQTANAGFSLRHVQLGAAAGVTPTAGKLVSLAQYTHTTVEDVYTPACWNGILSGGGNVNRISNWQVDDAYSDRDDTHFETTAASAVSGSSTITCTDAAFMAALQVGMYVFGIEQWNAGTPFLPLQPNDPYASGVQCIAKPSGTTFQLGTGVRYTPTGLTAGTPINAIASASGVLLQASVNRNIAGYTDCIDTSLKMVGAEANSRRQGNNLFARTGSIQTPRPGHASSLMRGIGTQWRSSNVATKVWYGLLLDENGPLAPGGPGNACAFLHTNGEGAEHCQNALVAPAFSRFNLTDCSADLCYGDGYVLGCDANYNLSVINNPCGDATFVGCRIATAGGHGVVLGGGNVKFVACVISGNGNPPGQPFANNTKDGVHLLPSMAYTATGGYKLTITGSDSGGSGFALSPGVTPISGLCPKVSSGLNIYCPGNFQTGLNAQGGRTFSVIAGTGSGQSIPITSSAFVLTGSTVATTTSSVPQPGSNVIPVSSAAGIAVDMFVQYAHMAAGSQVTAVDAANKLITCDHNIQAGASSGEAVTFGAAGDNIAVATGAFTALDTTSRLSVTQATQRAGLYLEGDSTHLYDITAIGQDFRDNITAAIYAPNGAAIGKGVIANCPGISDVVPTVTVTAGVLGLAINPIQQISGTADVTVTKIGRDTDNTLDALIQIVGTAVTLVPASGHTIALTAGNNIGRTVAASSAPVTLRRLADGKYYG